MESLKVEKYMNRRPVSFKLDIPVAQAVEKLLKAKQIGGPVVDKSGHVLGWISEQDCLRKMLESSYYCEQVALVEDLMRKEVLTVGPEQSILDLAQQMLGDKPKAYPVIEDNILIGVITRREILQAIDTHLASCFHAQSA